MIEPPEVIEVHTDRVACDGGGGALGHPRVWLELGEGGKVECGYCDRLYVRAGSAAANESQAKPAAAEGA